MPGRPAARLGDMTAHGSPLAPGPGSSNVFIGKKLAWRGLSLTQVAQLLDAANEVLQSLEKATLAVTEVDRTKHLEDVTAAGEKMLKIMGSVDQHACPVVKAVVPDGNGVVIDGSQTVLINGLPACRMGDTIQEVTSVNKIAVGEFTVLIGD